MGKKKHIIVPDSLKLTSMKKAPPLLTPWLVDFCFQCCRCETVHSGYMNITRRFDALDDWIRSLTISVGKPHQRNTSGRGSSWPCWGGYGGIGCSAGGTGHWSKVLSTAQGRAEVRRCDSTRKLYVEGCVILLI